MVRNCGILEFVLGKLKKIFIRIEWEIGMDLGF